MYNGYHEVSFNDGAFLSDNEGSSIDNLSEDDDEELEDDVHVKSVQTKDCKRAKIEVLRNLPASNQYKIKVPERGTLVKRGIPRCFGPFIIGPTICFSPVRSIVQCLARKEGTNQYYSVKILTLSAEGKEEKEDVTQGKILLHTEYTILSLLHDQPYVTHHYGLFQDYAIDEKLKTDGYLAYTGRVKRRLCLVLDCVVPHEYDVQSACYINLQQYVIKKKSLREPEAINIFYNIVRVVEQLHKRNIVHRDLKLGNFALNLHTYEVTITNFCLAKQLSNENDLLTDQRGSPAYISPEVLYGVPYKGKPSDMWALGVVIFTMIFGHFPFYNSNPTLLFNKIKAMDFEIPHDGRVTITTAEMIHSLIHLSPDARYTATELLAEIKEVVAFGLTIHITIGRGEEEAYLDDKVSQVVPEYNEKEHSEKNTDNKISVSIPFSEELMGTNSCRQPIQTSRNVNQIPVHTHGEDARELHTKELEDFQCIINRRGAGHMGLQEDSNNSHYAFNSEGHGV